LASNLRLHVIVPSLAQPELLVGVVAELLMGVVAELLMGVVAELLMGVVIL
jgi:hypothetical protein